MGDSSRGVCRVLSICPTCLWMAEARSSGIAGRTQAAHIQKARLFYNEFEADVGTLQAKVMASIDDAFRRILLVFDATTILSMSQLCQLVNQTQDRAAQQVLDSSIRAATFIVQDPLHPVNTFKSRCRIIEARIDQHCRQNYQLTIVGDELWIEDLDDLDGQPEGFSTQPIDLGMRSDQDDLSSGDELTSGESSLDEHQDDTFTSLPPAVASVDFDEMYPWPTTAERQQPRKSAKPPVTQYVQSMLVSHHNVYGASRAQCSTLLKQVRGLFALLGLDTRYSHF
jgi:hypothetical protein